MGAVSAQRTGTISAHGHYFSPVHYFMGTISAPRICMIPAPCTISAPRVGIISVSAQRSWALFQPWALSQPCGSHVLAPRRFRQHIAGLIGRSPCVLALAVALAFTADEVILGMASHFGQVRPKCANSSMLHAGYGPFGPPGSISMDVHISAHATGLSALLIPFRGWAYFSQCYGPFGPPDSIPWMGIFSPCYGPFGPPDSMPWAGIFQPNALT